MADDYKHPTLVQLVESFADEVQRARHHADNRGRGGQQVQVGGDFPHVAPSTLHALERWVRDFRAAAAREVARG